MSSFQSNTRLDDGMLAVGWKKYTAPDGDTIFRLRISNGCCGEVLFEQDMTEAGLRALERFAQAARSEMSPNRDTEEQTDGN